MDKEGEPKEPAWNHLPGLGLSSSTSADSEGSPVVPPSSRLVPAIYVEGEGYVPANPSQLHSPLNHGLAPGAISNGKIEMVPEHQLVGYEQAIPVRSDDSRLIDASGSYRPSPPRQEGFEPIVVSAKSGWSKQTEDFDIFFLEGDCCIRQGNNAVQGPQAVVWIDRKANAQTLEREVSVYLESDNTQAPLHLELSRNQAEFKVQDKKWFGRFTTSTTIQTLIMSPTPPQATEPAIFLRGLAMMSPDHDMVRQMQYLSESAIQTSSPATPARFRRITLVARGDNLLDISFTPYPNNPERGVGVITKGLNLIIEGVSDDQNILLGNVVDISADHAVIWGPNLTKSREKNESKEESNLDFEVYLEGNIIFRDGARTIEAQRMYYDAKNHLAYILDGRLSTPIIGIKGVTGSIRLKAETLQQLGGGQFMAKNALVTTSQLGEPTYSLRSRTMTLTERPSSTSSWDGEPTPARQMLVAENNYVAARNFPVLYWPWMAADLRDPTFYIKNLTYGNSSNNGNMVKTVWNPFQILNIRNRPDWLDGDFSVSWLEKRGIAHGARVSYSPSSCCFLPGPTRGSVSYWGIDDKGLDVLGGGRSNVEFPHSYRYQFIWEHRQKISSLGDLKGPLQGPWELNAQIGKMSDRNFVDNYFPYAWKDEENHTTSIELKKTCENASLSLFTEYALDDFVSNPNWLPRLDHYWIGKSLLQDRLTWYEHTRIGYSGFNTASAPYDYQHDGRYFRYLPWELVPGSPTAAPPNPLNPSAPHPATLSASGEVFSTRHELDLPFSLGPVRCTPYVLGDFSHWGTDRNGDGVQRLYGQAGVRLNLPFWKVSPNCSSQTWYVNGLAHKIDFDSELSYARADHSMDELVLTDSLDTWSTEDFRRRYITTNSNFAAYGILPVQFDPRYYALRSGLAGNVSASNMEIADDMTLCRFGVTQRWQTKRGPVGRRHIIDWITLSTHFNYYPESKYNYGKSIGLVDYDFLWHVGDRFSVFSSGLYDFFDDGQKITRIGGRWGRPDRGNLSLMLDHFEGIIDRTYLSMSVGYKMNEKYSLAYTTSYDIKDDWKNVGHNFMFVRTGESFRIMVGAVFSEARNEWSFNFGLEPVFMKGLVGKLAGTNTIRR